MNDNELLIFFIKAIPSGLFGMLFYFYSGKREFINKHPESIIYKLFKWIDNLIITEIKKEKHAEQRGGKIVTNPHTFAGYDDIINISDAKIISFNLGKNIVKKEILIFSTILPLFIFPLIILLPPVLILVFSNFSYEEKLLLDGLIFIMYIIYLFVFTASILGQRIGFFGIMRSIYKNDGIQLILTEKMMLFSTSVQGEKIIRMKFLKEFGVHKDNHIIGLFYLNNSDKITWIIRYPTIYTSKVLTENELIDVKDRLNNVLCMYKN